MDHKQIVWERCGLVEIERHYEDGKSPSLSIKCGGNFMSLKLFIHIYIRLRGLNKLILTLERKQKKNPIR